MSRICLLLLFLPLFAPAQAIAITFDDAPTGDGPFFTGAARSERIINSLKEHKVKEVAFFVLTSNIASKQDENRLKRYSAGGHLLANHSHTHSWIHQAGTSAYIRDIGTADSILNHYAGYMKWFRYPYLDEGRTIGARDSIREGLKQMALTNGYVTVDNYDWYLNALVNKAKQQDKQINLEVLREVYIDHIYKSIQFYDDVALKHIGRSPKHVLLLHENDLSALFIGDLFAHLTSNGWKIISPREAYQDPIAGETPDVLFNGQGRVSAIARSKGTPARQLIQRSEDEVYLDSLVREKKVFE